MQSQMRVIAGALFAAIAMVAPEVPLVFQQSSAKLHWGDLSDVTACETTSLRGNAAYNARKKAGIAAACFLLNTNLPARQRRSADEEQLSLDLETGPMQTILRSGEKRDDLADSLLHLLAYDVRRRKVAVPKRSRKRRKGECETAETVEQASPGNSTEIHAGCQTRGLDAETLVPTASVIAPPEDARACRSDALTACPNACVSGVRV